MRVGKYVPVRDADVGGALAVQCLVDGLMDGVAVEFVADVEVGFHAEGKAALLLGCARGELMHWDGCCARRWG